MKKGAIFSSDRNFRYVLYRVWDEAKPKVMCIGLNPSTANSDTNDPTINNLISILTKLEYGGLVMVNLFALISPDPEVLRMCPDPVQYNDIYIHLVSQKCKDVIFCWGNFKQGEYRAKKMIRRFPNAKCFGKNKNGTPCHPLALMYNGTVKKPQLLNF